VTTAVIYARLSAVGNDPDNVPKQLDKGREFCEANGYEVVGEFHDDETSAFDPRKKREDYDRMVDLILKGDVDVIVARHQDRLMRNIETFGRLLNFAQRGSTLKAEFYAGGGYDFGTASGGFQGGLQTLVGWYESAVKSERVREAVDRNRRKGKRVGGGPRWFGYEYVYDKPELPAWEVGEDGKKRHSGRRIVEVVLRESEAELIRDAAKRVLSGESLRSIANEWNDNGITKVKGGRWTGGAVSQLLESPHLAAIIHWQGEVIDAEWPAVLDKQTHERLVRFLHHPGRRSATPGSGKRKHLLVGLLYCGSCGGRLVAAVPVEGRRARSYLCRKDLNPVCPRRVRVDAESLEEFVAGHVIDLWRSPKVSKAALADDNRHEQLVGLADQIAGFKEDLAAAYREYRVEKIVDLDTYKSIKKELDAKVKQAERERSDLEKQSTTGDLPDPAVGWDRLTNDEKRLLLEMLTPHITVGPHPKGVSMRPFADPAREAQRLADALSGRVVFE